MLQEQKPPKSSRLQYHVVVDTKLRNTQKPNENENDKLEVKPYPKRKKQKSNLPFCPSCRLNKLIEFDRGYSWKKFQFNINKKNTK